MKLYFIITALAFSVIISGCGSSKNVEITNTGVVKTETASETECVIHNVLFGTWVAQTVNNQNVDGIDRPYIEFGEDTSNPFLVKCYAYDGCNYFNGEYAVTPGGEMKRTTEFISTMRMCEGAKYEMGFSLGLNNVTNYAIEKNGMDYVLLMKNEAGENLMTFVKSGSDFINGAWDVTSINGTSVDSDLNIRLVVDLIQGSVHGNAGCNTINGKVTTNPDKSGSISFSNIATTKMMCPALATERALLEALSNVVSVAPGQTTDSASLRNEEDVVVVSLTRAKL